MSKVLNLINQRKDDVPATIYYIMRKMPKNDCVRPLNSFTFTITYRYVPITFRLRSDGTILRFQPFWTGVFYELVSQALSQLLEIINHVR